MNKKDTLENQIKEIEVMREKLYQVSQQLKLMKAEQQNVEEKKNWMGYIYENEKTSSTSDADIIVIIFNCTEEVAALKTQIKADEIYDTYTYDVFPIEEKDGMVDYNCLLL